MTAYGLLDRTVYWLFRLAILITRPFPVRLGYWFGERVALICYWGAGPVAIAPIVKTFAFRLNA